MLSNGGLDTTKTEARRPHGTFLRGRVAISDLSEDIAWDLDKDGAAAAPTEGTSLNRRGEG